MIELSIQKYCLYYVYTENGSFYISRKPVPALHLFIISKVSGMPSYLIKNPNDTLIKDDRICLTEADARKLSHFPDMDIMGNEIQISVPGHEDWQTALTAFYWDTLIPCVTERISYCYPDGYVLSTLQTSIYGGTYPDVDHEFQCKARIALGDAFDLGLVQRMIELQCRLMREDPIGLYRNPCALQANGDREYHVRRNSMDGKTNAEMFLISGNIEVIQSTYRYICETGNLAWLNTVMPDLEGALSLVESLMDPHARLWSDVFYEDQVMKDGSECMSAALAADAFSLFAELEEALGCAEKAGHYRTLSQKISSQLIKPLPMGFWDEKTLRFADWLDRDGKVHDHIHLLANELPLLFSYCTDEQKSAVRKLLEETLEEIQRFPSFLSPHIEDYTDSEIGDGGPYDLCAAGRYWCWDAQYHAFEGHSLLLERQLSAVSEQAMLDGYRMGERYDMNHIFYIDEKIIQL